MLRLTPGNKDRLLFDDVLWVHRAQQEHDRFAEVLRERGVTVHLFADLLRRTLDFPDARLFADAGFEHWSDGADNGVATTEGGDVLVVGNGAVLVGMSGRTTAAGVERLAQRLFAGGAAEKIVAVRLPVTRSMMHLDTVMTVVLRDPV